MQQFAITIKRHLQVIRHSVHATKTAAATTATATATATATTTIGKIKPVLVYFIWRNKPAAGLFYLANSGMREETNKNTSTNTHLNNRIN
jgi:hypothetical protein